MDGGGWSKKKFFHFAETLHTESTLKVIILLFGIWRDDFVMGLKNEIEFENLGFFAQNPDM